METTFVFTDGACSNNQNSSIAKAGYGIYFGKDDPRNISQVIIGKATNNIAELTAVIEAIKIIKHLQTPVIIVTDSNYVILCGTSYGRRLAGNNWTSEKPIPNIELVKELYYLLDEFNNIQLYHIRAHTGKQDMFSIGNAEADRLAVESIGGITSKKEDTNIYLNVPFHRKEEAKNLKAKWNPKLKKWYTVPSNKNNPELLRLFS